MCSYALGVLVVHSDIQKSDIVLSVWVRTNGSLSRSARVRGKCYTIFQKLCYKESYKETMLKREKNENFTDTTIEIH